MISMFNDLSTLTTFILFVCIIISAILGTAAFISNRAAKKNSSLEGFSGEVQKIFNIMKTATYELLKANEELKLIEREKGREAAKHYIVEKIDYIIDTAPLSDTEKYIINVLHLRDVIINQVLDEIVKMLVERGILTEEPKHEDKKLDTTN